MTISKYNLLPDLNVLLYCIFCQNVLMIDKSVLKITKII